MNKIPIATISTFCENAVIEQEQLTITKTFAYVVAKKLPAVLHGKFFAASMYIDDLQEPQKLLFRLVDHEGSPLWSKELEFVPRAVVSHRYVQQYVIQFAELELTKTLYHLEIKHVSSGKIIVQTPLAVVVKGD